MESDFVGSQDRGIRDIDRVPSDLDVTSGTTVDNGQVRFREINVAVLRLDLDFLESPRGGAFQLDSISGSDLDPTSTAAGQQEGIVGENRVTG